MAAASDEDAILADDAFEESGLGAVDYQNPKIWDDPHNRRAIMASLVRSVYRLEKDRAGTHKSNSLAERVLNSVSSASSFSDGAGSSRRSTEIWWKASGYELIQVVRDLPDTPSSPIFAAVFRHSQDPENVSAPKIVVSLRGTLVKSKADLKADFYILIHSLSRHPRFHTVHDIVRTQMAQHGPQAICLAGHSKGAALALLIGRKFAESQTLLEAHLFNPPLPSIHMTRVPALTLAHNAMANTLARAIQSVDTRSRDRDLFLGIASWQPHVYVNMYDPVSSGYVTHFDLMLKMEDIKKEHWFGFALSRTPRSIRSIMGGFVFGANIDEEVTSASPENLIPSAHLFVVPRASSMREAHDLRQWLDLNIEHNIVHIVGLPGDPEKHFGNNDQWLN